MKKWVFMVTVLLGLTLVGCSNGGLTGSKPPKTNITVGNETNETVLGSYCWGSGCSDTAGPQELLEGKETIKVKPGEKITIVMNYKPKPNEIYVTQIDENEETEVEIKNNGFKAPTEKGVYYYAYSVWWMDSKEKNLAHGDAFYAFVLEVD